MGKYILIKQNLKLKSFPAGIQTLYVNTTVNAEKLRKEKGDECKWFKKNMLEIVKEKFCL